MLIALLVAAAMAEGARPALKPEDYGRFEQLAAQRTPLSPDGKWLVYGINRSNRQNEIRVQQIGGGAPIVVAFGEQSAFSDDSRWLAYLIGFSEEQEAKLRKDKKPIRKQLGLLELSTGKVTTFAGIESFSFSPNGSHLAMRHYAPEPATGTPTPSPGEEAAPKGSTLVVRDLASGTDTTFGSVSEIAWQDKGTRLAFAVTVDGGVGNGVQLYDTATGTLRALSSSSSIYSDLAWRKESASLAALRSRSDDTREGADWTTLAWPDLAAPAPKMIELDARKTTPALDPDLRVVRFRAPTWSHDGAYLFVGIGPWRKKPVAGDPSTRTRRVAASSDNPDELPDVQVWHPKDATVMPKQKLDANRDRERSMLAAFSFIDGRLVRLSNTVGEEASPVKRSAFAIVVDTNAQAMDRSLGRVTANVWALDLRSGKRTDIAQRIEDRYVQTSPGGRYVLFLQSNQYFTVDLTTGKKTNLTGTLPTSFVDKESDDTGPHKPGFGVAGWTKDDAAVLLYDKLDIWEIRPDGSGASRITNGAAGEVRSRYVRLDPEEEWIDRTKPIVLSQFGIRSKKSGYARLDPGATAVTPLLLLDKRVDRLSRAKKAERFAYAVQDYDDSPDYFTTDATFKDATQATTTNPFMKDYAMGRSVLLDYKNKAGAPLQAGLFYPANYDATKKYPMVVYMYEKLSDGVHTFSAPSERDYYNAAAFTSGGYFLLQPDIVFRPREPGLSVIESVVPAVEKVVSMGLVDKARVGIVGHSWGGFDSVYLASHTNVFKAAVAGAPITDLVSNYGNHHWSSGIAETDHIETGQQRMEVPLYEDLQAYIRNSALYKAHVMTTPLLIMFGDNDGTVHFHQGVSMYNIARRAGRNVVLLTYGGEDHGLRKRQNQIDYHHRIREWFDHYLSGAKAPRWITDGERYLDRQSDLQQRKLPAKPAATTTPSPAPSPTPQPTPDR